MADKVQLTLESLIPEMDALVKKGLFTKKEAKKIIKKRRYYEYQFEKTNVSPLDYFKAIRYEKVLNKRMAIQRKKMKIVKLDYNDYHFIRRIIVLFKKCIIKFGKDEHIWLEYFHFLIQNKCNNVLNKEIGKSLIMHPSNITFWKIAAYNEFENNFNSTNARELMLKCIRLNERNIQAYLEYFVFEIKFAEKIAERKKIIKGEKKKLKVVKDVNEEKEKEEDKEEKEEDKEEDKDDIINLKIAALVWKDSLNKLNLNLNEEVVKYHFAFLDSLERWCTNKQINSSQLEQDIIKSILDIDNTVEIKVKIAICKLHRYINTPSELVDNFTKEFNCLIKDISNAHPLFNYIIFSFLSFANDNMQYDDISPFNIVVSKVKDYINIPNLKNNLSNKWSIKLLSLITSPQFPDSNIIPLKEVDGMVFKIISTLLYENDIQTLNDAFAIIINLKGYEYNEEEQRDFIEKITDIKICNGLKEQTLALYIKNVISLIGEEISYYIKPDKAVAYFQMLSMQIEQVKGLSYESYKVLYMEMLSIIIDKSIQMGNDDEPEKYYSDAIEYIKRSMQKKLIGFSYVLMELIKAKRLTEENTLYIKWMKVE